ncbi:MAG: S24 family peptidase [Patescibacteria group bacterium]
MHNKQALLLTLAKKSKNLGKHSLRQIAKFIGEEGKPQTVKYHLRQLEKAGLIQLNLAKGVVKPVKRGLLDRAKSLFYSLPIVGAANCGPATVFADERVEGYLKVSTSMLPHRKDSLYVLVAEGDSMNRAEVRPGAPIEDGDFVVVDSAQKSAKGGDIVVAVIDGMATIKRYREDRKGKRIILSPESTEKHLPIFVGEGDDFSISGKVVEVIKQ